MIAFLVAELQGWYASASKRTIGASVVITGLSLVISNGQTLVVGIAFTGLMLWVGWLAGSLHWNPVDKREWREIAKLPDRAHIPTKAIGAFIILIGHLFVMLPALLLTSLVWGADEGLITRILAAGLVGGMCSASCGLLFYWTGGLSTTLVSGIAASAWLVASATIPPLMQSNPLVCVWFDAQANPDSRPLAGIAVCALTALVFAVGGQLFRMGQRKVHHENRH